MDAQGFVTEGLLSVHADLPKPAERGMLERDFLRLGFSWEIVVKAKAAYMGMK